MPIKLPMDAYSASNNLKAGELFIKRKIYQAYAFYDSENPNPGVPPPPIRDFWRQEDFLYGRINQKGETVEVGEEDMVLIEDGVKVINFVATAYRQMKKEFTIAAQTGRFSYLAPPFTDFKAVRGYISPRQPYQSAFPLIQAAYLPAVMDDPRIKTLKDFVPPFLRYLNDMGKTFPINYSSFLVGPLGFIGHSGLSLEIADFNHDSDEEKIKDFILNPCFEFYKNVALKYGFYIDMNAPWRLVANLASPQMQKFMKLWTGVNTASVTTYFQIYTSPGWANDITNLQNFALSTYNALVELRPVVKERISGKRGVKVTSFRRSPADLTELEKEFSYLQWLKFYIHLKNKEKDIAVSDAQLTHIFNNSKNLVKSLDNLQALGYINRTFDELRSINGSYNYARYKTFFDNMDKSNWPFTDFQEYFERAVSLGIYKRY